MSGIGVDDVKFIKNKYKVKKKRSTMVLSFFHGHLLALLSCKQKASVRHLVKLSCR